MSRVEQGIYPPLLPVFNYTLLKEEEEWEICFVYLLPYPDLLEEVVQQHTVHRIPLHLIGLSKCLSRYYSRVKVLKDPLPQLIPIIHSRIQFLQEIQKVFQSSLYILGLQHLDKM
ncbi:DALR anticodon-binding domain-containing protein 3-like isoform X1 [Eurytemora carolleeae]|uniref:DALR anticodon-binding domain-containing protein 3-like isoform X1 n=1 Tax=Eurytemora carolleeae TaxID=1294199 RepID=UPI000C7637B6|nr:DALR anticodon-binding domain-containing protein 3-like isoform X1 [Eurytemora carolleeae]|eukprot:XP_023326869.1 DALR anticodon-binding domain-containing protein 3-like isoform X1 [Eurytemora affinis]